MMGQVVEFFDPYPSQGDIFVPLPPGVKSVIDKLNGERMTLDEGIKKIQAVTNGTVEVLGDFVTLNVGDDAWRLIFFRHSTTKSRRV